MSVCCIFSREEAQYWGLIHSRWTCSSDKRECDMFSFTWAIWHSCTCITYVFSARNKDSDLIALCGCLSGWGKGGGGWKQESGSMTWLLRSFTLCGKFMAIAQAVLETLIWFGFIFNNLSLCLVFILHYLAVNLFFWRERNHLYSIPTLSCFALLSVSWELSKTIKKSMI